LIPSVQVGDIEFNRIPQNYFQDVEQVAFSPANIVPGMGYSPDRLLQVRNISVPFKLRMIRGKKLFDFEVQR
jgi:catalase